MKVIVPIAVLAIILTQASGVVPQSSVGGPMTLAIVYFSAMLAVGIHDAWTHRRGVLGWIVSLVVAFVGSFVAAEVMNLVMEPVLMSLNLSGSLAEKHHGLLYVTLVGMMLAMLFGAWGALQLVNRWR